jgi:hemerythrin
MKAKILKEMIDYIEVGFSLKDEDYNIEGSNFETLQMFSKSNNFEFEQVKEVYNENESVLNSLYDKLYQNNK